LEDVVAAPNLENLKPTVRDQVEYIRTEFKNSDIAKGEYGPDGIDIGIATSTDGVAFMYAEGQILVREHYLARVQDILDIPSAPTPKVGEPPVANPPAEPVIDGVSVLSLQRRGELPKLTVIEALNAVDRVLGPGYATPNHLLTVAGDVGPCPATEPEVVDFEIEPYPSVCPGDGGAGISVYIADTGLIRYSDDPVQAVPGAAGPGEIVTNVGKPNAWLKGVRGDIDPRLPGAAGKIEPYVGHGAFVAGVARCLAPGADIYVANAFKVAGSVLETHLARHLDAALAHGYDLFHLSITAPTRKDLPLISFERWLSRLRQYKCVACVVAAGNSGSRLPTWPAAFPEVVSVGALAGDWRSRARFSNYGPWVDVYAPGRDLVNAFGIGTYKCYTHPYKPEERKFYGMAKWSGTSFSTPIVTGLIAARMSRTGENGLEAAAALLAEARSQAIPGVGAVLLPCCHDHHDFRASPECCCRTCQHRSHTC
jgi:subtilisin family serine protease